MLLPQRPRILSAKQGGPPAEDVLRFVQPAEYPPVLRNAYQAFSSQVANEGLESVNILSGKCDTPTARQGNRILQAKSPMRRISDRASGVLEEIMRATEVIPPQRRAVVFSPRILTFRLQCGFFVAD